MYSCDLIVIGGGIVGMATAMSIQKRFPLLRVLVLEKEATLAAHQSGHNSGVIHSGIYYRPDSLKARMCVRGRDEMVRFCEANDIPHEICGKVIVATCENDAAKLPGLLERAKANKVPGVRQISSEELRELEPHAAGVSALFVPSTGIVSYAEVTRKYADIFRELGGTVRLGSRVIEIVPENGGVLAKTEEDTFKASAVVNCAGLFSDVVAKRSGSSIDLAIIPFRGEYYKLKQDSAHLVRSLIYPVPDSRLPFLGVHFTRRISGEVEAGPNAVLSLKREGYGRSDIDFRELLAMIRFPGFWRMASEWWRTGIAEVCRSISKSAFVTALQTLVPQVRSEDLETAPAGVRAQAVSRAGRLLDDFCIVESARMIHVCNVPSPAATASLQIGEAIAETAARTFWSHLPSTSLATV